MESKPEYVERLRLVVERLHTCRAVHLTTAPVRDTIQGGTGWEGDVEIFALFRDGKAKPERCFAWSYQDGNAEQFAAVLDVPPVNTPLDAVRAHIAAESRKREGRVPPN